MHLWKKTNQDFMPVPLQELKLRRNARGTPSAIPCSESCVISPNDGQNVMGGWRNDQEA